MDKKILSIYKNDGKWDFIENLEQNSSIGFDVKKARAGRNEKQQHVYHSTEKELTYKIREGVGKQGQLLLAPIAETFLHNSNKYVKKILHATKTKPAIINDSGNAFCEDLGECTVKDLDNNYYTILHDGTDLEDEFYKRQKDYREICDLFGIVAEDFNYASTLTCRAIMYEHFKNIHGMEHVTEDEDDWIMESSQGGLMLADKGIEIDELYKYDINSMYGFLMQSEELKFPLTKGIIKTKTKINKKLFAIWKLKINGQHRLFKRTQGDKYTPYHIKLLDHLKIPYELDQCENNVIIFYDPINSCDVFEYMRKLFELKKNGNKHAKEVINCTWGEATRRKSYEVPAEDVKEDRKHLIVGYNHVKNTFLLKGGDHPFKYVTARLKPFLLSYARYFIVTSFLNKIPNDKLFQVNTDGFCSTLTPEEIRKIYPISPEFGHLKIEKHYTKAFIKNCHKIILKDKIT